MNCTCIPDLEAILSVDAEAGKLPRPEGAAELLSLVCINTDMALKGNQLVQRFVLILTATWRRDDGREVPKHHSVKALFCPLCGKSTEG
ncbi:MAG: hypothetical protein RL095_2154 [Verrucomicrobiota bacterium]|jgi:hypothetical protein